MKRVITFVYGPLIHQKEYLMKKYRNLITLLAGLFFLLFTGGKYNVALLAWIPNIFLLRYYRTGNHIVRYIITSLSIAVISMFSWYGIQPLPLPEYIISMIVTSLITTLPLVIDRLFYRKVPAFAATLVFPVAATLLEYLFISGNPMGSFGALAYSQSANLPLVQLTGITGLTGITFLMNWFPAVANKIWKELEEKKFNVRTAIPFGTVIAAVHLYGIIMLLIPASGESLKASAIYKTENAETLQSIMGDINSGNFTSAESAFQSYLNLSAREIAEGQEMISWPEGAVIVEQANLDEKLDVISSLASENRVIIAAPFVILNEDSPFENSLYLFGNDGEVLFKHIKYGGNMFEGSVAGNGRLPVAEQRGSALSAAICWDLDFPAQMLQAGRNRTDIFFGPANDWKEITPMHGEMAIFRAVENGMSLVRPAMSGLSLISDYRGRKISEADWFSTEGNVIRGEVPVKGITTVYSRTGDILPLIMLGAMLAQIIQLFYSSLRRALQRRRSTETPNSGTDYRNS